MKKLLDRKRIRSFLKTATAFVLLAVASLPAAAKPDAPDFESPLTFTYTVQGVFNSPPVDHSVELHPSIAVQEQEFLGSLLFLHPLEELTDTLRSNYSPLSVSLAEHVSTDFCGTIRLDLSSMRGLPLYDHPHNYPSRRPVVVDDAIQTCFLTMVKLAPDENTLAFYPPGHNGQIYISAGDPAMLNDWTNARLVFVRSQNTPISTPCYTGVVNLTFTCTPATRG